MAKATPRSAADKLRRQADVLLDLADDYEKPSRSMLRVEMLIGRVEQVAEDVRAFARGR